MAQPQNSVNNNFENAGGSLEDGKRIVDLWKELIKTDEEYVAGLKLAVEEYIPYIISRTPTHLITEITSSFEDIIIVYKKAEMFLESMKNSPKTGDNFAEIFINHETEFKSVVLYFKNKPRIDGYLKQFKESIGEKQRELKNKMNIVDYLQTPSIRLGAYCTLLNSLQTALNKMGTPLQKVDDALSIVRRVMKESDNYLAINSIKGLQFAVTLPGSLLRNDAFLIVKPKKFKAMVFLFENVIVFTEKKTPEEFIYVNSVLMNDLTLEQFEEKPTMFKLTSFTRSRGERPDASYTLETDSSNTKDEWVRIITRILMDQFEQARTAQERINQMSASIYT